MRRTAFWIFVFLGGSACLFAALRVERFCMAPFREAQTAISVRSIAAEGTNAVTYTTPVFGQPSRIPMEFGLFQWLVAQIPVGLAGEDNTGRLASVACYLLCGGMVFGIARRLQLPREAAAWTAAVFLLAPVHLAFGAAYLIESFALALALLHFWSGLIWLQSRKFIALVVCLLSGMTAAMVKGPTWAVAAFALGALALEQIWVTDRANRRDALIRIGLVVVVLTAGLVAGLLWVQYGDRIKLENPSAAGLVSGRLKAWNYGTLDQKLSPVVWASLLLKEGVLLFGPLLVVLPVAVGLMWRRLSLVWRPCLILVAAFLSAPAVFTNLHYRHQYYLYANGVYLVLAGGLILTALPAGGWRRLLAYGLPLSCLATSALFVWQHRILRYAVEDRIVHVLSVLPSGGAVALRGMDWSPYIPYYARQNAWFVQLPPDSDSFARGLDLNRQVNYQAVVWQGRGNVTMADILRRELLADAQPPQEIWPEVWISLSGRLGGPTPVLGHGSDPAMLALNRVRELTSEARPGLVQFLEFHPERLFTPGHSIFRCVLRRGPDLIYFDSSEGLLWRFSHS